MKRIYWSLLALLASLCIFTPHLDAQKYIRNQGDVPRWNQHHDYRHVYQGRPSAVPQPGGTNADGPYVTYDNLASDPRVHFAINDESIYGVGFTGRQFMPNDYFDPNPNVDLRLGNDLAGGGWHCAPTATGMWMEWLRQNSLHRLANRGGEIASIEDFAQEMDTNQQHLFARDGIGRLGTSRENAVNAADNYVHSTYDGIIDRIFGPHIVVWHYSRNGYLQMIDRSNPPVVFYQNQDVNGNPLPSGHVVVGVGYTDDRLNAIVADPWNAMTRNKPFAGMRDLGGGGLGVRYGDPHSASFDADWTGTRLHVMAVPDWGDAPSPYLVGRPAAHSSGLREWLGASVSSEITPFDKVDDEDGVANVGDQDRFDDGIILSTIIPGTAVHGQAIISSRSDMRLDEGFPQDLPADLPAILFLNGWIDWNKDTIWEDNERILHLSLAADFDGSVPYDFFFDVPIDFIGETWSRFRLDRGQDVGPYGIAWFGEMEDYRIVAVPEPSAFALLGSCLLGLSGYLWRRRIMIVQR